MFIFLCFHTLTFDHSKKATVNFKFKSKFRGEWAKDVDQCVESVAEMWSQYTDDRVWVIFDLILKGLGEVFIVG